VVTKKRLNTYMKLWRKKIDEVLGMGRWKEVRDIHSEFVKKGSSEEMEGLLKKAIEITNKLDGLDKLHAEIYIKNMRATLARWKVQEKAEMG
jgi:uncharacterized protein YjgD (DUF1641 family)